MTRHPLEKKSRAMQSEIGVISVMRQARENNKCMRGSATGPHPAHGAAGYTSPDEAYLD
jgi:hypothetical protein